MDTGKDQGNIRIIRKTLDDKFKEIDNYLARKVMTPLLSLTQETGTRLDGIERSTYETRDSIKRDSVQKFANMKDQIAEVKKEQNKMYDELEKFEKKVQDEADKNLAREQSINKRIDRIDRRFNAMQKNLADHIEKYD